MYKFNLVEKLNEIKVEGNKKNRFITLVSLSSIALSLVFVAIIVFIFINIKLELSNTKEALTNIKHVHSNLKKRDFFSNESIKKVLDLQLKRVHWSQLFATIDGIDAKKMILTNVRYGKNNLDLSFMIKTKLEKSDMFSYAEAIKDSLATKPIFKDLLASEKSIKISKVPELNVAESSNSEKCWLFSLEMEFLPIITGEKKDVRGKSNSRLKRFN